MILKEGNRQTRTSLLQNQADEGKKWMDVMEQTTVASKTMKQLHYKTRKSKISQNKINSPMKNRPRQS